MERTTNRPDHDDPSNPARAALRPLMAVLLIALTWLQGGELHAQTELIPLGATWNYLDTGVSQDSTAWKTPTFDDSSWKSGQAQLGYGSNGETTTISFGTNDQDKHITYYFRHTFTVTDPNAFDALELDLVRDDGAVVYLNGTEVFRSNMPTGTISSSTLASSVASGGDETAQFTTSVLPSLLVTGTNVVAVEVHQENAQSSDVSFDLRLQEVVVPEPAMIPLGSSWEYLDDGSDQDASAWKTTVNPSPTDGSSWATGPAPLGYGDTWINTTVSYGEVSTNKYITTYFRRSFDVTNLNDITGLQLGLVRDDGAVVYLNGTEVFRSNMPTGTISSTTVASVAAGGTSETALFTASISPNLLVNGDNVMAVEIHQSSVTSSDITFDLQLRAVTPGMDRGPYLQMGGTDRMTICWRTNIETGTVLRYGTTEGTLDQTVTLPALATDHVVDLTGLTPDTKYYYSVGTSTTAYASGPEYYFETHPAVASTGPTRLWVLGDSGTADVHASDVRDAFEAVNGNSSHTDLVLMLGDNAYDNGTDAEYQAAVFEMYPDTLRNTVVWPTLGNHDAYTTNPVTQTFPYYDIFELPTQAEAGGVASATEAYYSFDYANIHFVCLDSHDTDRTAGGAMATWLVNDLAATTQEFIVAFWHHPPYSKGSHNSDTEDRMIEMRQVFTKILEDYGVDLVLCGHSHSYERSMLINGHYGLSTTFDIPTMALDSGDGDPNGNGAYQKTADPNQGAVYTVAGSSGKISGGTLNHPVMVTSQNLYGSVIIDVDGLTLKARFIGDNNAELDTFTIKHVNGTNQPPTLVNNSLRVVDGVRVILSGSDLSATDPDDQYESLTFSVSNVTEGAFQIAGTPGTSFTQAQVTADEVEFVPNGSGTAPTYAITVSDGEASVGPQAATITFTTGADPYDGDIWTPALETLFGFDQNVFDAVNPVSFGTLIIDPNVYVTYTFRRRTDLSSLSPELEVSFSADPDGGFVAGTLISSVTDGDFQTDTYRDTIALNANGTPTPRYGKISIAGEETETFATIPIAIKEDTDTNETPITRFGAGVIGIKVAEGTATAVGAFTLTDDDARFGSLPAGAFYVLMTSGPNAGARAAISANTTTQLTQLTLTTDLNGLDIVGESYEIRQYLTIGDLFGPANEAGLLEGANSTDSDNLLLTRTGIETFFYSNGTETGWKDSGALDATDEPIDPLVPLAIRRRGTTGGLTVYPSGAVPRTSIATTLVNGNNFLALPNSIPVTPGKLGLDNLVQRGANPVTADNLLVFQADGSVARYFYVQFGSTTGWYDSSYAAAVEIPAGSAIVFQRRGTTPIQWTIPHTTPPPAP